jgi:phosphoribosylaminoimidazolecarboxamide formyltransferase / IMP cyclohydrolase
MTPIRRALFSLTDKRGAAEFARVLAERGVQILSTGNTAKTLREAGVAVTDVSDFTGFPEILDGRVKTLHPRIHGGLLARRDLASHLAQMAEHGLEPIDLVCVNLYPFERVTADPTVSLEHAIENIDIGGPSMLRSAAKNHEHVAVVVDPDDYPALRDELAANDFVLSDATRRKLALKVFQRTAAYDLAIARYLAAREEFGGGSGDLLAPPSWLAVGDAQPLRYGENPHQRAVFCRLPGAKEPSIATARILHGKELSYNNILDSDAALALVREFERPAAVIVKHTNPCGAALADDSAAAFEKALAGDPVSAFGGILAFNRRVNASLADVVARPNSFFECIIAPEFEDEALEILTRRQKWGANVRLLACGTGVNDPTEVEVRKVRGGLLLQSRDETGRADSFEPKTRAGVTDADVADLRFAWVACKHVKSNAIVLAKDEALVGVGAGQMSRVDSVRLAVQKSGSRARGAVLASDAFFPFRDGIDEAAKAGVRAIVQPGGSVRDKETIAAADEHGIAMVFTGVRHFRH